MKTLDRIDLSNAKSKQMYEDLLRKRLCKFGFKLSKGRTLQPGPQHIRLKYVPIPRGYEITDAASGDVVAGENHTLSIQKVEKFWLDLYLEKREQRRREREEQEAAKKRPKTIKFNDRWTITNDDRAIRALNSHVAQYGAFDTEGHGAGGDIAAVMYRAYRPYACPEFSRVWPSDGNRENLTDCNLRSDADEMAYPDGVVPITTQRRVWHDRFRTFIKLPIHDWVFFTEWNRDLFNLLSDQSSFSGWYIQTQTRKTKTVRRLYCRLNGKTIFSFAEVVALFDAKKVDLNDITGSLLAGKRWLRESKLQVDHLRDNTANNCVHNLVIIPEGQNNAKSDIITGIMSPFAFIPVRAGEKFRVVLGKCAGGGEYFRYIICDNTEQLLSCMREFQKIAKSSGEMLPIPEDQTKTNCISQMLCDDGQKYHGDQLNTIEALLRMEEDSFTPWNGDVSILRPDDV